MKFGLTKRRIILSLSERKKTLSEISKEIGLSKSSVYQHLIDLQRRGFVERLSNKNKFVYYRLTEKGREILDLIVSVVAASLSSLTAYYGIDRGVRGYEYQIAGDSGPITLSTNIYVAILSFIFVFVIVFFLIKIIRSSHF